MGRLRALATAPAGRFDSHAARGLPERRALRPARPRPLDVRGTGSAVERSVGGRTCARSRARRGARSEVPIRGAAPLEQPATGFQLGRIVGAYFLDGTLHPQGGRGDVSRPAGEHGALNDVGRRVGVGAGGHEPVHAP